MSVREHDFHREIVNMFNQIRYEWRTNPIILGGSSGSEGGSTGAPGGVVGQVGQRNVTGDTSEGAFLISSGSIGSLLDNLKRIRYWELPSRQFGLEENVPANTTWAVSSGSWYYADVTNPLIYLGGQTPPITLPSSGSRLDILTISSSGILQWLSGTSGSAPTMPTVPSVSSGSMPIFAVVIRSSGSACRNYDNGDTSHYIFRDMRPFLDWGIGGAGGSSGSFVPGSIPFGSGSGVLTEENQYLYWDTVYKRLLRGTNTFGAYDSIFAFPGIYNVNQNNDGSGFVPVAFGAGSPGITGIKINGTIASPTGVLDGNVLVRMSGRGWGATAIGNASRSRLEAVAVGNWTDAEQGAKWDFYTTGSATTTVTKAVTITDQQELQIHALNTGGRLLQTDSSGIVSESNVKGFGTNEISIGANSPGGGIIVAKTDGYIALGAGLLAVNSNSSDSIPNHTHAITSSSDPGAAASILASSSSGFLKLEALQVTGDIYTVAMADYGGTSTVTGWAATPTKAILYKKIGNQVFVAYMITGTSDSATATFTVPYTSANSGVQFNGSARVVDNGSAQASPGRSNLPANSATVTVSLNWGGAGWTASGTKTVEGEFWYFSA